jgi:tetratricopeptide (TPR) repeat protein
MSTATSTRSWSSLLSSLSGSDIDYSPVHPDKPDAECIKVCVRKHDTSSTPSSSTPSSSSSSLSNASPKPMEKVYVNVVGQILPNDDTKVIVSPLSSVPADLRELPETEAIFLYKPWEEFAFTIGRGEIALGLQMVVTSMVPGDQVRIYCGKDYGYNDTHRPDNVDENDILVFDVIVRWCEKEPALHEMDAEAKKAFVESRREIGKRMFAEQKFASAREQYSKALVTLEGGLSYMEEHEQFVTRNFTLFHNNYAVCAMRMNDDAKALEHTCKALKHEATAPALLRRAVLHEKAKDFEAAIKYGQLAIDMCKLLADDEKTEFYTVLSQSASKVIQRSQRAARVQRARTQKAAKKMFASGTDLYDDKPDVNLSASSSKSLCSRICGWFSFCSILHRPQTPLATKPKSE